MVKFSKFLKNKNHSRNGYGMTKNDFFNYSKNKNEKKIIIKIIIRNKKIWNLDVRENDFVTILLFVQFVCGNMKRTSWGQQPNNNNNNENGITREQINKESTFPSSSHIYSRLLSITSRCLETQIMMPMCWKLCCWCCTPLYSIAQQPILSFPPIWMRVAVIYVEFLARLLHRHYIHYPMRW